MKVETCGPWIRTISISTQRLRRKRERKRERERESERNRVTEKGGGRSLLYLSNFLHTFCSPSSLFCFSVCRNRRERRFSVCYFICSSMAMILEAAAIPARDSLTSVYGSRLSLPKCSGGFRVFFPPKTRHVRPSHSRHVRSSRGVVCEQSPPGTLSTAGEVTDKTWKEVVLQCDVPVLVDFWAPWCGPCRMIAPIMDELAKEYNGRVRCVKLNTDESPNTATEYGIRSIPTVMVFKGGEKKDTIIGAVPKTTLVSTIEKFL